MQHANRGTAEWRESIKELTVRVASVVRELETVPSGHLYARLMGILDLHEYNAIVAALAKNGFVRHDANHLLTWIGEDKLKGLDPRA